MSPPSEELQVNLLGAVRIRSGGRRVDITSGRVVALLAYLILHRSERQARSSIAYLFWPESSDGQARTNLRQLLHQLRRVVPFASGVVRTDAESMWWDGQGAVAADVIVFEEAIEAAEGKPTTAALTEAVNAYGGDLLPGYWNDWVLDERERLRSRWLALSSQLCDRLVHEGHYRAAIRALQRHLVVEPTDEQAHRRLMGVHAACGERTRALHAFHRCERVLRRELDVEPSDATRELYAQLVSVPLAPTPVARPAGLVGRTDELAQLREAWRRVTDTGRSVLVLVTGEAGIGKTALVEKACWWCEQQGATAAWARCYDEAAGLSLAPVAAWLRHPALSRALDGLDEPWRREVARVLPELDEAVATSTHPFAGDRRRLFEALVRGLSGVERLVLVVDDLQWSDPDTIDLLAYLLTEHATEGLLVVATARDGPTGSVGALGDLRTTLSVRDRLLSVALVALDGESCAELARSAGGGDLGPEQVVRAVQESGGNPLFCIEIARAATLGGPDIAAAATPRIRAVIEQRLSALSPSAAEVAEVAAVVGRSFDAHLLVSASELSEVDLADGLDELWHHRIVADTGPAAYDFTHDKLREVAYQRLAPARRRILHDAVAEAMSRRHDVAAVGLARHLELAGRPNEAIGQLRRAADEALRVFAHGEVADLCTRALDLLAARRPGPDRDIDEVEVRTVLGSALVAQRGYAHDDVLDCYERARALAKDLDGSRLGPVLRGLAIGRLSRCELRTAAQLGRELRSLAARDDDPVLAVEAAYVQAVTAHWEGHLDGAIRLLEEALASYEPHRCQEHLRLYAQDPSVVCTSRLAFARAQDGDSLGASRLAARAVTHAIELAHPPSLAYAHTYAAWVAVVHDDHEGLSLHAGALAAITSEHDLGFFEPTAQILSGWLIATTGEPARGRDCILAGIAAMAETGQVLHRSFGLWLLARALLVCGDPTAARAVLVEAREHAQRTGQHYLDHEVARVLDGLPLHGRQGNAP